MKKSVNYWMLGGFEAKTPVLEAAELARAHGYDAIEFAYGAGELSQAADEEDLAGLKAALDAMNLQVSSLATGNYWSQSLSSPDATEREAAIEFTRDYIQAARVLGAESVLVIPGSVHSLDPSKPVVPAKQVWELASESIHALIPTAEEEGVTLALENVWNKFLTGPFELAQFIDAFKSPYVQAYFDVGNCLLVGFPEHWIRVLGDRISRVHIKNFKVRDHGGTLNDFTDSLMKGDVNWPAVFDALKKVGYDSYLTAEMIVSEKGMPDFEHSKKISDEMTQLLEQYD